MPRFTTSMQILSLVCDQCGRQWVQIEQGFRKVHDMASSRGWQLTEKTLCRSCCPPAADGIFIKGVKHYARAAAAPGEGETP
jgi:hypothetical protein